MILQSHPTGNTYVRHIALALAGAGLLEEFWTCLSWNSRSPLARLVPPQVRSQLERRVFDPQIRARLHTFPLREAARLLATQRGWNGLTRHESGILSVDAIFQSLDARVARRLNQKHNLRGVYAQEDGALDTFKVAKTQGLARFYDLPIAHWAWGARLMAEESERWPQWKITMTGTQDSAAKRARKDEELELCDVVFAPSDFVRDSLPPALREGKTCVVAPFGSPWVEAPVCEEVPNEKRPLRVLFAGLLTQRKGLADVFAAFELLARRDVELVVLGRPVVPLEFYRAQGVAFSYHAPCPHPEVLRLMASCDALVLPSLVEGRALVQQEALACGLPLIITPNTGGADLIEPETGFLVPIRSPAAIAEAINWMADHRAQTFAMRAHARRKAAQYTWQSYGATIVSTISQTLTERETPAP